MSLEEVKTKIQKEIDNYSQSLIDLSHKIHENPELGWQEVKASGWLIDFLKENGFRVEQGIADLPTAFRADYGNGKPVIAFMAEYDALPTIGHGCGHNIIAAAAIGAAMGAKILADENEATLVVLGCPAEELLGGKVLMVEKGAFDEIDAAMQIHAVTKDENWAGFASSACIPLDVEFFGEEAHAAADPWNGISALEAIIQSFNNINSLRLHLKDRSRISGIVTKGGEVVNIIPGHAACKFQMRSPEDDYLDELKQKVLNCIEGAAMATGCRLEYRWGMRCNAMRNNMTMLDLWKDNMAALGREVTGIQENSGSTDTANVSVTIPCIHGFVSISKETLPFHSKAFCDAAGSQLAEKAVIDGAKAMAMTAADLVASPDALSRAKKELEET